MVYALVSVPSALESDSTTTGPFEHSNLLGVRGPGDHPHNGEYFGRSETA
jgi:hypothetical protein